MNTILEAVNTLREDLPDFNPGDTIVIDYKVVEGDKERIQPFQGVVIAKKGRGINQTFTVRRVLQGIGVERVFPMQSPLIKTIKVVRKGSVRRAKLYYLRTAKGKKARIKESKKDKPFAPEASAEAALEKK